MKNIPKKLLMFLLLINFFNGCFRTHKEKFAADAPVKKLVFDLPFPSDLIYQATPDAQVIVGTKEIEAYLSYEVSGFDVGTGGKLWQLPFAGKVVGRTEKQILVYEEKTSTLHFITPRTGEITRRISPAPILLTRINFDLYSGMAFTDEMYLTTKALYTNIFSRVNEKDESFPIGITAKSWASNETVWFVPPDGQLVTVSYPPLVFGDKVLIMNAPYGKTTVPSYKVVSLKTGEELFRGESNGDFHYLADKYFIEATSSFVRRIEPLTGQELWKISGDENHFVSSIANQITLHSTDRNKIRTLRIVEAETGKLLKQFEFSSAVETRLEAAFLTKDGSVLLNFNSKISDRPFTDHEHYNYWAAYDAEARKVLWRTDFESHSVASLFPFASDKLKFEH
jgi:outer membrane protein assembly factor BamB